MMEAFLSSTLAVAIAEIGDKTQLLALFLAARYGRPYIISLGVLVATLVNHAHYDYTDVSLFICLFVYYRNKYKLFSFYLFYFQKFLQQQQNQ
jgi:putative Ca2+/H+ antiporter (TMEM165/GDT1 family)